MSRTTHIDGDGLPMVLVGERFAVWISCPDCESRFPASCPPDAPALAWCEDCGALFPIRAEANLLFPLDVEAADPSTTQRRLLNLHYAENPNPN